MLPAFVIYAMLDYYKYISKYILVTRHAESTFSFMSV